MKTTVVETSQGNYHAYWLIAGCSPDRFTRLMKKLAAKLGSDPKVCDLPRVMRVPGTINWKYEPPFLCRIVHQQKDAKPIKLSVFKKKMGLMSTTTVKGNKAAEVCKPLSDEARANVKALLDVISPDDRSNWLKVGMAIHSADQSDVGYDLWTDWAKSSEKFDEAEHRKMWNEFVGEKGVTIKSLYWMASLAKRSVGTKFDEGALAALFAESYKDVLRYCPADKGWYWFNGTVWIVDSLAPIRLARELMQGLQAANNDIAHDNSIQRFLTVSSFKSIVSHAELIPALNISPQDFDKAPNLLAVENGVIELATGVFRQAQPSDYLRRQANVAFDAGARCPEWVKFMRTVISNGGSSDLEFSTRMAFRAFSLWGFAPNMTDLITSASNLAVIIGDASNSEVEYCQMLTGCRYRGYGDPEMRLAIFHPPIKTRGCLCCRALMI